MPALPDFRLEAYFSRWEFAARYNLTASDAQTMSMAELLELADDDARGQWESLHLGYTETYGLPASIYRSALTATPADRFRVGVGRLGAQEALDCWAAWLDKRR
jgi:hypothetical protein